MILSLFFLEFSLRTLLRHLALVMKSFFVGFANRFFVGWLAGLNEFGLIDRFVDSKNFKLRGWQPLPSALGVEEQNEELVFNSNLAHIEDVLRRTWQRD